MPDLITGDNLIAFDIIHRPDPDDETGPDFHLAVYTLEGKDNSQWVPWSTVTADQLAGALRPKGFLPPDKHGR